MRNVLFVCVHNSGRSQMAEAMREVGIDLSGAKPKPLTSEMLDEADLVVTMGCGVEGICPASFVKTEDWELEDPEGKALGKVREIRDEIEERVKELL